MLMLVTVNAQASTINLKDGEIISGTIIQQDKTKVVVNVDGTPLTFYKDQIKSMKDEPLLEKNNGADLDADKLKLAEQFINVWRPTSIILSEWIKYKVPPDEQEIVSWGINNDQFIRALTKYRSQGIVKYFSSSDLKAALNFYSSPEGQQYLKDSRKYQSYMEPEISKILKQATDKEITKNK
jgi:hypothetical protein